MLHSNNIIPKLVSLILLGSILLSSYGALAQDERAIVKAIQSDLGGEMEHVNPDRSRVDLLTDEYAIEVDYARKWKESIGQSLWYALQTNRKAAIVLIIEGERDFNYVQKLQTTIDHNGLSQSITVIVYPDDFQNTKTLISPSSKVIGGNHWLSTNSNARHNSSCRWFEVSKGRRCRANHGKAAGCCGG